MRCLAAVPILPFILAGCATLGPPASHAPGNEAGSYTVAFDPAQSPGRPRSWAMAVIEAMVSLRILLPRAP